MVTINSIEKGLVIDHIKAGLGIKIYNYLNLSSLECNVALITSAESRKMGKKDIIKVENMLDLNYDVLGLLDQNITVNMIDNGVRTEKRKVSLPLKVKNIIECKNPRCITSSEKTTPHRFKLLDKEKGTYKCCYCEDIVKPKEVF